MADGDLFIDVATPSLSSDPNEAVLRLEAGVATLFVDTHPDLGEGELQAIVEYLLAGLGFITLADSSTGHVSGIRRVSPQV
jgi:hypothetical protein